MKIGKILANVKPANRLATLALGAGLMLSCAAKAQARENVINKDTFTPVETTQKSDKDSLIGGFAFGGAILAWMGAVALGNKLHDKKQ